MDSSRQIPTMTSCSTALAVLFLVVCSSYLPGSQACNPAPLVRQTPAMAYSAGIPPGGMCPTSVLGRCAQCYDNSQCPGNQLCCPVSGLYCCVALRTPTLKQPLPQVPFFRQNP